MDWVKLITGAHTFIGEIAEKRDKSVPVGMGEIFGHVTKYFETYAPQAMPEEVSKNCFQLAFCLESAVSKNAVARCQESIDSKFEKEEDVTPELLDTVVREIFQIKLAASVARCVKKNPPCVLWFLRAGYDMHRCYSKDSTEGSSEKSTESDFSHLGVVVDSDNISLVWKLLQHGLDVNLTGKSGSPLFKCVSKEMYDFLMAAGADDKVLDEHGRNAYFYIPVTTCLDGCDVNVLDENGYSILYHRAVSRNLTLEMAQYLVERGSDLHLRTKEGKDTSALLSSETENEENENAEAVAEDEPWKMVTDYLMKCYHLTSVTPSEVVTEECA